MRSTFWVSFLMLVSAVVGCEEQFADFWWDRCPETVPSGLGYTCCELDAEYWAKPERKAELCPDAGAPDAGGDSGDLDGSADGSSARSCTGDCVPLAPGVWDGPMLFWLGPPADAPSCPAGAPKLSQAGWLDLTASNECPPCECDPPDGTCEPPATFTVHSELCYQPGSFDTPYHPPSSWGGMCTAENPIPAGQDCPMGSGIPCVRSITFGPPPGTRCLPSPSGSNPGGEPTGPDMGRVRRDVRVVG